MKAIFKSLAAVLLAINAMPAAAQTTSDAKADGKAFGSAIMDRAKDAPGGLVTIDPAASSPAPAGQNAAWQASIDRVNARFDQENPNDRH